MASRTEAMLDVERHRQLWQQHGGGDKRAARQMREMLNRNAAAGASVTP